MSFYRLYLTISFPHPLHQQLEAREREADQIMKLSECCRKLETEEQKVLPFREAPLTDRERGLLEAAAREPAEEPLAQVE